MSTEGDSAKSVLSDANDKSGTDNHTDTSQDSADISVSKDKSESQTETKENDAESDKNSVKKADENASTEESEDKLDIKEADSLNKEKSNLSDDKEEKDDIESSKKEEKDIKKFDDLEETSEKPDVKNSLGKEDTNSEDKDEGENEQDAEDEEEEEDEIEEESDSKTSKVQKKKSVPLLDQPLETTGKRERKNVQRFSEPKDTKETNTETSQSGSGTALGEIPRIDASISRFKNDDLQHLYRLLFKQAGKNTVIKKQIKKFNGFSFARDSEEYKKKVAWTAKFEVKHLKSICEMLDLVKTGTKDDIIGRILEFLLEPKDKDASGKTAAGGRPKRASAVRANNRGYSSHDDYSSDEKHSSRARRDKGKRSNLKDESSSDEEFNPENVSDGSDEKPKVLNKRKAAGRQKKRASSDEDDGSLSELSSEDSDDEPKNKRKRPVKTNNKVKAKSTPRGRGRPKATPRQGRRGRKSKDTSEEEEEESDQKEEGSSSEDEPLVKKKKTSEPPTDEEIKTFIKSILEGANLEEITMKTVCQRVYANYPDFSLSHKKDFIKTTVKSLIST